MTWLGTTSDLEFSAGALIVVLALFVTFTRWGQPK
jgi:hypothetical protein